MTKMKVSDYTKKLAKELIVLTGQNEEVGDKNLLLSSSGAYNLEDILREIDEGSALGMCALEGTINLALTKLIKIKTKGQVVKRKK